MADHKLDIFETLAAIDRREKDFFSGLSPDQQKGFAPPVVLRWASAVSDGPMSEHYIWLVNERANINFWDISDHPELQFKLLASCGAGRPHRHQWVPMVKKERKSNQVRDFVADFYPNANDLELDIILDKFTDQTFEDFVLSSGKPPEEIKEVLDAYDRLTGKIKPKAKKARGKKAG